MSAGRPRPALSNVRAQVVGAVFVQQTMKMANSDEELAFRQKERETLGIC